MYTNIVFVFCSFFSFFFFFHSSKSPFVVHQFNSHWLCVVFRFYSFELLASALSFHCVRLTNGRTVACFIPNGFALVCVMSQLSIVNWLMLYVLMSMNLSDFKSPEWTSINRYIIYIEWVCFDSSPVLLIFAWISNIETKMEQKLIIASMETWNETYNGTNNSPPPHCKMYNTLRMYRVFLTLSILM